MSAQTLAQPGWNASGFNAEPWWRRAVFYEVSENGAANPLTPSLEDNKALTANLDAVKLLGADALILPMPASQLPGETLDSFDDLIRQASTRNLHILLTLSTTSVTSNLSATVRFWLSRGVSGFRIATPPQTTVQSVHAIVQAVQKITSSTVGGRIVISDAPDANADAVTSVQPPNPTRHARIAIGNRYEGSSDAQLQIDTRFKVDASPNPAKLRLLLSQSELDANAILELRSPAPTPGSPDSYPTLQRAIATIALTTHPASLIQARPDLLAQSSMAKSELTSWYRQLIALHRGNATLQFGSVTTLDFDAQNALVWVSVPAADERLAAPVVVVCNLSSSPLKLSLGAAMKGLNLHGFYLRTLLRTDKAMGAQDINAVTLPPLGIYIGELHR